jgi:hypothetical protein
MVPVDLIAEIKNSFRFRNDNNNYALAKDSVKVRIPSNISDDNEIGLSPIEWLYCENITEFSPDMQGNDTVYVEPYQKLKVECTYIIDKYTVSYIVTLVHPTTHQEFKITGNLTGTFLREMIPQYQFETIEDL